MKDHIAPILEELRKAREEIQTLRAENAKLIAENEYLRLDTDRLEALNRSHERQEKRLLESARILRDENAALLAERDEMKKWHDAVLHECMMTEACYVEANPLQSVKDLVTWHVDAEREQWIKQEPHPIADILIHSGYLTHDQVMDLEDEIGLVYRHPLPAQQIPEGINIDDIIDLIEGYEIKIEGEWGTCRGIDELIKEGHMPDIYYKLLSASQPKGDV